MILKLISGGQTGADQGGLIFAKSVGIQTGGWMPKGFITKEGPRPEFAELYNMLETIQSTYPPRTAMNVSNSDGTIRFARHWNSGGEILTLKLIKQYNKPYIDVDRITMQPSPAEVRKWILDNNIKVLNVAGNSEETSPGITQFVIKFLHEVMAQN